MNNDEVRSSTVALAFMDLPTLGLMTSFSLFIYYIAQLTLQLEMEQLGLFEDENTNAHHRRQMLLHQNSGNHLDGNPNNQNIAMSGLSDKYQKPNVLKPLFIIFNTLAYVAYIITILAFILSKKSSDQDSGQS